MMYTATELFSSAIRTVRSARAWRGRPGCSRLRRPERRTLFGPGPVRTALSKTTEAFLTDSPGIDGGAYDIDWSNTRNVVQRNYAHDTQGYCFAVFAAGYVTSESVVRGNLCIDNGLSPRLAAMQGAAYISTWNGGVIRNLRIENNAIGVTEPPVASAAAIVNVSGCRRSTDQIHRQPH